ncbi:MFS transporter [Streptomyces mobaraensis NBRC 13819 = DSM 40847]|uniref:Major facilitator superfamily permease n=1 Tax=Streptomyces mobaraensis (strain ATCC 29032 / DSM 40847 / JCM 4168 / NBRC 13819 / NCIMB 11159 / IPCR 16-22) TaxID=1223523 RepID=M3B3H6_STRM1|nr:MFS transporter [Streptomyces mobaraensis]EMF00508.1 major facilitator superfamily permease [Streptomyces mobaraensis NBRC 13819 = DSM 40847]QTT74859.1 MFS transporter [Streptomyces mobaraensis NBRC 13819 = DSM 40847]
MSARQWGVLLVLCGAVFLEGIDVAMLNVALPVIRADLGLSTGELQWVMSAYVLGYGGLMLLGGRAADLFGRRRMFISWLAVFLLFSGLGGFATEGWMLITARFVTGVAAAFITPAGLSVITTGFAEGAERDRALLIYSGTGAGGFSLGLVAGGLLGAADWRWVFFAPVAVSAVLLAAALVLIPRSPRPERAPGESMDLAGAVTATAAIVLLVLTVERAAHGSAVTTAATAVAGLGLLAVFVAVERRTASPLVRLGILRAPLVRSNLVALLFAAGFFGFQFLVVLYLQELRGWSTLRTSFAMIVIGIDAILSPTLTPRLVRRFGNARLILGGMLLAALAYALFLPVGADWTYALMLPSLVTLGLAFSLAYGPLTIVATEGVDEEEQGLAGGLLYTFFQFGAALGLAGATAVNIAATPSSGSPAALLDGYRAALLVPFGAAVLAAVVAAFGLRGRKAEAAVAGRGVEAGAGAGAGVDGGAGTDAGAGTEGAVRAPVAP